MTIHQHFSTQDIVLAATLKSKGHMLVNIEKDGNKGIFCFRNIPQDLILQFDLRQLEVEPVEFNNTIKGLTTAARRLL